MSTTSTDRQTDRPSFLRRLWPFGKGKGSRALARRKSTALTERLDTDAFIDQTRNYARALGVLQHLLRKSVMPQQLIRGSAKRLSTYNRFEAIDNGLKASLWVYACTTVKARAAASVPWVAEVRVGERWELAGEDHPLQSLINMPNEEWGWPEFMEYLSYNGDLGGESFITKIRSQAAGSSAVHEGRGQVVELWVYDAATFDPKPGVDGERFITAYCDRLTAKNDVEPEDMIHFRLPDPGDLYRGLAPLTPAQNEVDIEQEASIWQLKTFANLAVPPGIFSFVKNLNPKQFEAASEFFEENYQGALNARSPLLLGNEVKWIDLARSAVDMDFQDGRRLTREGICAAFGVPPMLVGIQDKSTYNNFATAELVFWKLTMIPFLDLLKGKLNRLLSPEFGDNVRINYDTSNVDALLPMFAERIAVGKEMVVSLGVPLSIVNDLLQLKIEPFEGWDQSWRPINMVPTGRALGSPESVTELPEPIEEPDDAQENMEALGVVMKSIASYHDVLPHPTPEQLTLAATLVDRGMSWDVAARAVGFYLEPFAGSDVGLVAVTKSPLLAHTDHHHHHGGNGRALPHHHEE